MIHSNINISEPPKTFHHIKQSCLQNQELMLWILRHNRGLRIWLIIYAHQLQLQYFQRSCISFQKREREKKKKTSGLKCSSCQRTQSHPHPYVCIIISCSCISGFWFKKKKKKASTPIHPDSQTKCNSCNDCSHPGETRASLCSKEGNQALSWAPEPQHQQLCLGMQNSSSGMQSCATRLRSKWGQLIRAAWNFWK